MCPNCRAFISTDDKRVPVLRSEARTQAIRGAESSDLIAGFIPHAGFTTFVILLINLGLYAATVVVSMSSGVGRRVMDVDGRMLIGFGAKFVPAIVAGQWWRW